MIKLYQFPSPGFIPNFSPFCVKLETYLKLAGIPYENVYTMSMGKNPKKLMPYIEVEGKIKGDSSLIIDFLKEQHGDRVDFWLTEEQQAISSAFIALMENRVLPFGLYFRWVDEQGWSQFRDLLFARAPKFIKILIGNKIAKKVKLRMHLQGISRYTIDEMMHIVRADFNAVSSYLGDKEFFFGDKPSLLDIVVFSVFANLACVPIDTRLKSLALEPKFANLVAHSKRMLDKFYHKPILI